MILLVRMAHFYYSLGKRVGRFNSFPPDIYTRVYIIFGFPVGYLLCQSNRWITQNSAFSIKSKYSLNLALFFFRLVVFVALSFSLLGFVESSVSWFSISDLYCKQYTSLLYDSTVSSHSPTLICVMFFSLGLALTKDSARKLKTVQERIGKS